MSGSMMGMDPMMTQADGDLEPIPPGSLPQEVADDLPAMLSDGEFVVPADALRWHGMSFFVGLINEAKEGFAEMESTGLLQRPAPAAPMEEPMADPMMDPGMDMGMDPSMMGDMPMEPPMGEPGFAKGGLMSSPYYGGQDWSTDGFVPEYARYLPSTSGALVPDAAQNGFVQPQVRTPYEPPEETTTVTTTQEAPQKEDEKIVYDDPPYDSGGNSP